LEIGEDRGVLYHAMELIDGESLRKLYRDIRAVNAAFPLGVALRVAADVCAGLHAVHELRGPDGLPLEVVHRDVSPQNVLITVRGTVKVIDFGVAKARERRTEETTAGTLKGKIEYMAPEQARGEHIDRRADVYAIGAVLYELLAGDPVRNTEDGRQLLALHELMTGAPYEPLHTSVPLPVRSLVDRALSRDPQARFRTTEDMRRALEQVMIALGQVTTTDDVAKVLQQFSAERTQRRKDAIDAVVRGTAMKAAQQQTVVAPLAAPVPGQPLQIPAGPSGTQILGASALLSGEVSTTRPSLARGVGEGPSTGPSMRTMQGASISGAPPPPSSSVGKVVAAAVVLSLVAVLGVVAGVVVSRPATGLATTVTTAPGLEGGAAPVAEPIGAPIILGASDAGGIVLGASDAGPAAIGSAKSGAKKTRGKERAGASKADGDDYGF
jgi:serine/threonine-protein kinase